MSKDREKARPKPYTNTSLEIFKIAREIIRSSPEVKSIAFLETKLPQGYRLIDTSSQVSYYLTDGSRQIFLAQASVTGNQGNRTIHFGINGTDESKITHIINSRIEDIVAKQFPKTTESRRIERMPRSNHAEQNQPIESYDRKPQRKQPQQYETQTT